MSEQYLLHPVLQIVEAARRSGKTIVFSNGVFDILHRGHVEYLTKAKALGDILVVGVNNDDSVRRLKGENRPLMSEQDRAYIVQSLKPVDRVVLFAEDTPIRLIEAILPDVLVKGADYQLHEIVGHETVLATGGKVERIALTPNRATTGLVELILERYGA